MKYADKILAIPLRMADRGRPWTGGHVQEEAYDIVKLADAEIAALKKEIEELREQISIAHRTGHMEF